MDEVPKHRKKGGKKPLSSLSTKHLWNRTKSLREQLGIRLRRIVDRGLPDDTWALRPDSIDWSWQNEFWHDAVDIGCDALDLLIVEIEGRMDEY